MHVAAILKVKGRNVVTTTADKSLLDVAKLLEQHDIGCIVIEGDEGQVAGIVSERDVVRAVGKSGAKVLKEPVSVYMTKTVVTAREADPIDRLMSEMTVHRFRRMPVVERGRANRPRLHWRCGQDAHRGSRHGGRGDEGVRSLAWFLGPSIPG
jgi:CBS domain-containing protein